MRELAWLRELPLAGGNPWPPRVELSAADAWRLGIVDGESIGDIDHDIMKERGQLARNGILLIDISLDKHSGKLLHDPEILTRGFVTSEEAEKILPEVRKRVMLAVNGGGMSSEKDIINTIKSYLHQETKRRPMVFVTLSKA